ncbi:hypothetical protein NZK35_16725 [Stieleria sp. ICT_E10.1]|uniref:hypothetical protein n=1 Tax=Stieleria sedimenti TaxID=2976331 RepID=UPI00217F6431|nr:hypothetical protein [Stieleria sedimenti]MCS7468298.1 hypothetical protein [Stieleria sedimenti]
MKLPVHTRYPMRIILQAIHPLVHWIASELLFGELTAVFLVLTIVLGILKGLSTAGLLIGIFVLCAVTFCLLDGILDRVAAHDADTNPEEDA